MTAAVLDRPLRAPLGRLLAAEVRWTLRRPRTIIALAALALAPVLMGIGIAIAGEGSRGGPGGLFGALAGNGFVLPIVAMYMLLPVLLPLLGSMAAADALAGESAHGTLRGLLLAPVSRGRLLAVKAFGVAVVVWLGVLVVALSGVVTGLVLVGSNGLITLSGTTLSVADALLRIGLAVLWVGFQVFAVASIALAVSAWTEHPLVVLAVALAFVLVSAVVSALPNTEWIQPYLLPTGWMSLTDVLRDPVPGTELLRSTVKALCYSVIGLSLAYGRLSTKDG
ncbi:ABC transporter permease subunit [Kutzneria viridogrisea]|uniref:ABC-2 type transport system permease protein n=2 Tax=Kutzneria TaxID=43356 RepID=W5W0D3_9PSEU|nr:ABC transporter permease subunit [Kutzneria albida]AHH94287.1 hypothetical protein KALB_913 [Kutzneria albida DSM 43870]MBA8929951.1 ABC-2 type transport system permease protein [Kutzneria viridogrisea]